MIERFSVGVSASRLASRYKTEEPTFLPRYNGAPSQLFPVLTNESPQGFSYFYWGVAPQWAKNKSIAERLINVRAEQIITVSERQPLALSREDEAIWLKNDTEESALLALLDRANGIDFDGFTVSPQLNSIQFDRPSLLLPVPAADQFGNLTLFD